jgi:ubiquinone/menaquinone biosynthesis C-methylase UbiE
VSEKFLDYFSGQADTYARARPVYPAWLYEKILEHTPGRALAWDCATGNGQAARGLARYFDRVIATDASLEQIAAAAPVPNVEYRVATAESSGIPSRTIDLVTVAQALHWLDLPRFYDEVRRVGAPHGMIAAWHYGSCVLKPGAHEILAEFEFGLLAPYWPANRRFILEGYRTLPFPFEEIPMPSFELRVNWTLGQLGGYLRSWSAVARYRRERGEDPVAPLLERLQNRWGAPEQKQDVVWPLGLRLGRIA